MDILDSHGALKSVISVATRKDAVLEIILTDLHTLFHPPTTLPPLQVDANSQGKDGDHAIVVFAPICNSDYKMERKKRTVVTRPLYLSHKLTNLRKPYFLVIGMCRFLANLSMKRLTFFYGFLRGQLDRFFPEKTTKMSYLDKDWMSPQLKQIHRAMQREFYRHRKSDKYKKLKSKFKKMKRKTIKTMYSNFVSDLKITDPGKWYHMAKKIGAVDKMSQGEIQVESLSDLNNVESAQKIAEHFSSISNEYLPINTEQLPSYLPALPPPQVTEFVGGI